LKKLKKVKQKLSIIFAQAFFEKAFYYFLPKLFLKKLSIIFCPSFF